MGRWNKRADPDCVENILKDMNKHKLLWRDLRLTNISTVLGVEHSLYGGAGVWLEVLPGGGHGAAHGRGDPRDDGRSGENEEMVLEYEKELNTSKKRKNRITCSNTDPEPANNYCGGAGNPLEEHPGGVHGVDRVCDEPQGGEVDGDDVTGRLRDREQGGGDAADGEHGGPLLHLDERPVGHDGDGEQLPRIIVRRKYRLKNGVSQDGRLQLGIKTFTRNTVKISGGGGSSDQSKSGDYRLGKNGSSGTGLE